MPRMHFALVTALSALAASGCIDPDPPNYTTSLPNGISHFSNGGDFGWFGARYDNNGTYHVYPVEDEWYCNEFAIIGDDVIGVEIQYGARAFVDPPAATRWFYLDSDERTAETFETLDELHDHCRSLGHSSIPHFVGPTADTRRM